MKNIRMLDLNIITAEWIGWGSRTDLNKRSRAKSVLASTDPVALDYYAGKYVLLPTSKKYDESGGYSKLHDPDDKNGPFRKFLEECYRQGIGTLDETRMNISQNDFNITKMKNV